MTVVRQVIYEGDEKWIDFILSKSLPVGRRELGGEGNFIEIKDFDPRVKPILPLPGSMRLHEYIELDGSCEVCLSTEEDIRHESKKG